MSNFSGNGDSYIVKGYLKLRQFARDLVKEGRDEEFIGYINLYMMTIPVLANIFASADWPDDSPEFQLICRRWYSETLHLDAGALGALYRATVRPTDLLRMTPTELDQLYNIGEKRAQYIYQTVRKWKRENKMYDEIPSEELEEWYYNNWKLRRNYARALAATGYQPYQAAELDFDGFSAIPGMGVVGSDSAVKAARAWKENG